MIKDKKSVLFVCMGNICRSPTAEGVFTHLVESEGCRDQFIIDSAGTDAYHIGEDPDRRSQATALSRGIDMSDQRSRIITNKDFVNFDYILAMDKNNYQKLRAKAGSKYLDKIHLFLDFSDDWSEREVPDPYYGGSMGFNRVFDMVESASQGLLQRIMS
ncbi:MAG: low molecular weight phosphotyrosine protein phosphatase [Thiotrichaceae bacterium]|nr:low molecular weight phosphotyrosine protein phosphatase [Thiotrichaceae bacterium]